MFLRLLKKLLSFLKSEIFVTALARAVTCRDLSRINPVRAVQIYFFKKHTSYRFVIRKPERYRLLGRPSIDEGRILKRVLKNYVDWTRLDSSGSGWRASLSKEMNVWIP